MLTIDIYLSICVVTAAIAVGVFFGGHAASTTKREHERADSIFVGIIFLGVCLCLAAGACEIIMNVGRGIL